jgi:hypothetical protein
LFNLFKKKKAGKNNFPPLADLDDNPLQEGDHVISLRYDLGECRIVKTESGIEYESIETGERVSWLRMIDAATEKQKVNKVLDK